VAIRKEILPQQLTSESVLRKETPMNYLLDLSRVSRRDTPQIGAKAANLGELLQAGFPVPPGFVLSTDAFDRFLEHNKLGLDTTPERAATASVPPDIVAALRSLPTILGDLPMAVRSSAVSEDLTGASFAGQYETVLGVRGEDALLSAVKHCWTSTFAKRVATYRSKYGEHVSKMAVLIQRLIQPEAAGVAFTANPVTGERNETLVSAVRGLGERLVSGEVSPDEWVVRGQTATNKTLHEDAIARKDVLEIADLARRVEKYFAKPQDIEWALAHGQLFLLQARPITTALSQKEISTDVNVPKGFWERDPSHYPQPLSPLFRSFYIPIVNDALKALFKEAGLLIENLEHREIGGWVYLRKVPLGGKDRPPPPTWLMWLVVRIIPPFRSRIKDCVEAIRSDKFGRYIQEWYEHWRPTLKTRLTELKAINLGGLSDAELKNHVSSLVELFRDSMLKHQLIAGTLAIVLADLAFTCRTLLGWDDRKVLDLTSGLSESSTEASRRLLELVQLAKQKSAVLNLLESEGEIKYQALLNTDPEFAAAMTRFQSDFGVRSQGYEVMDPTAAEMPESTLHLVKQQIVRGYDAESHDVVMERRRSAVKEARTTLANRPADLKRFERALQRAEQAYPLREDNGFYTVNVPFALLRYAFLELGERLTKRGLIRKREDIFFLEVTEVMTALQKNSQQYDLVSKRQSERNSALSQSVPFSYGKDPGPPPSFAALPSEARFAMEAMVWAVEHITAPHAQGDTDDQAWLTGIPASPGRYTGPVRVIRTEAEIHNVRPGDVLVCPITSPSWSVLFPIIGGLVTDSGGILSHPAIVAREYGIPAIVNTRRATELLRDDQIIVVDGSTGKVEKKF